MQPPSGGCVLKHYHIGNKMNLRMQPPSGGCVLKHHSKNPAFMLDFVFAAAAFGRLCVETHRLSALTCDLPAAACARLCVETFATAKTGKRHKAAASARLCVETLYL